MPIFPPKLCMRNQHRPIPLTWQLYQLHESLIYGGNYISTNCYTCPKQNAKIACAEAPHTLQATLGSQLLCDSSHEMWPLPSQAHSKIVVIISVLTVSWRTLPAGDLSYVLRFHTTFSTYGKLRPGMLSFSRKTTVFPWFLPTLELIPTGRSLKLKKINPTLQLFPHSAQIHSLLATTTWTAQIACLASLYSCTVLHCTYLVFVLYKEVSRVHFDGTCAIRAHTRLGWS